MRRARRKDESGSEGKGVRKLVLKGFARVEVSLGGFQSPRRRKRWVGALAGREGEEEEGVWRNGKAFLELPSDKSFHC